METIFEVIYFAVWLIYIVFSALIVDEDDRPAVVWIAIIAGSIWPVTLPITVLTLIFD